jgi:hypothetical protein
MLTHSMLRNIFFFAVAATVFCASELAQVAIGERASAASASRTQIAR